MMSRVIQDIAKNQDRPLPTWKPLQRDNEGEAHAFASDITCLRVIDPVQEARVGKGLQPVKFVGRLSRRLQRISRWVH